MMNGDYYIDLKAVTLADYEKELEQANLIPSRQILKEDLKKRFSILREEGLVNLDDIMNALKTPDKIQKLSERAGLPQEFLIILKREIASSQPKPVNLKDFPSISEEAVKRLGELGIKNTFQLFSFVKTEAGRKELSEKTGVSIDEILELAKLTDVSRIKWVGANFARLLVDSGCDTAEKVTEADYKKLYDTLMQINAEKKYFKGKFGLNDMKLCVEAAGNVPRAMQFD